ncbi:hypothetical protein ACI6Q2_08295 [Chitinophagaceae bacterium LWZ2-11]
MLLQIAGGVILEDKLAEGFTVTGMVYVVLPLHAPAVKLYTYYEI